EDGIRDFHVTGVQTCALPILGRQFGNIPGPHLVGLGGVQAWYRLRAAGPLLASLTVKLVLTQQPMHGADRAQVNAFLEQAVIDRSEERRVGKESRARWAPISR